MDWMGWDALGSIGGNWVRWEWNGLDLAGLAGGWLEVLPDLWERAGAGCPLPAPASVAEPMVQVRRQRKKKKKEKRKKEGRREENRSEKTKKKKQGHAPHKCIFFVREGEQCIEGARGSRPISVSTRRPPATTTTTTDVRAGA